MASSAAESMTGNAPSAAWGKDLPWALIMSTVKITHMGNHAIASWTATQARDMVGYFAAATRLATTVSTFSSQVRPSSLERSCCMRKPLAAMS